MLGKKGESISLSIFVFLTYALLTYSLFSFLTNSWYVQEEISVGSVIFEAYEEEDLADFYFSEVCERALIKTYYEFVSKESSKYDYIENPQTYSGSEIFIFDNLNSNFNEEFMKRLEENVVDGIKDYNFLSGGVVDIKKLGENYVFILTGLEFKGSKENLEYLYKPIIEDNFEIDKMSLNSFDEIYNFKESCLSGSFEERKICYESNKELIGKFDVFVEVAGVENSKYLIFNLKSKKEFLIEDNFKKIDFDFIVR